MGRPSPLGWGRHGPQCFHRDRSEIVSSTRKGGVRSRPFPVALSAGQVYASLGLPMGARYVAPLCTHPAPLALGIRCLTTVHLPIDAARSAERLSKKIRESPDQFHCYLRIRGPARYLRVTIPHREYRVQTGLHGTPLQRHATEEIRNGNSF